MKLGYHDEARAWRDWLLRAIAGSPHQVQIMYGVGGERWLPELTLPWLKGYADSSPVRIGNAASDQMQIDVFGEIADAAFQTYKAGMQPSERGRALRPLLLEYLAEAWRQPDEGIWEVRGGPQHFVHSKVMAWVSFDRAAHEVGVKAFREPGQRWREIADEIHAEVCERGIRPRTQQLCAGLWLQAARRELAADSLGRVPPRERPEDPRNAESDRDQVAVQ